MQILFLETLEFHFLKVIFLCSYYLHYDNYYDNFKYYQLITKNKILFDLILYLEIK